MKKFDTIVIGSGLAGYMAAAVSAKRGRKTAILSYGVGALAVSSGTIDLMSYPITQDVQCRTPRLGIQSVDANHPYKKIGEPAIEEAVAFFCSICDQAGYEYVGDIDHMTNVVTAIGMIKPSGLVPKTTVFGEDEQNANIYVVTFKGLKDYYPSIIIENLQKQLGDTAKCEPIVVDLPLQGVRDITTIDVARALDKSKYLNLCIEQLTNKVKRGSTVLLPAVLGTAPSYTIHKQMEIALGCKVRETVGLPPSVTGLRLQKLFRKYLQEQGVHFIEESLVTSAKGTERTRHTLVTGHLGREQNFSADAFILATGGFYNGGLEAISIGNVCETVFNLPVKIVNFDDDTWGNTSLFSREKQPFAQIGIMVDETMRPLRANGEIVYENVRVAGNTLFGYDGVFEGSGNGVPLASGYKAGMSL